MSSKEAYLSNPSFVLIKSNRFYIVFTRLILRHLVRCQVITVEMPGDITDMRATPQPPAGCAKVGQLASLSSAPCRLHQPPATFKNGVYYLPFSLINSMLKRKCSFASPAWNAASISLVSSSVLDWITITRSAFFRTTFFFIYAVKTLALNLAPTAPLN